MPAEFDIIIIGGGPAGVAAALQAARDGTRALLISNELIGGLVGAAHRLDNLPGFPGGIAGEDYGAALRSQIIQAKIDILPGKVTECKRVGDLIELRTDSGRMLTCSALILAVGTKPIPFAVDGLNAVERANAFHRDIRSLPKNIDGQRIIVIGGGEAAVDTALSLKDRGCKPTVVVRGERLKIPPRLALEVEHAEIEIIFGAKAQSVKAVKASFVLAIEKSGSRELLPFNRLLVCIGRRPRLDLWRMLGGEDVPDAVRSGMDGVFTTGDMIRGIDRYVACAIGDGSRAARLAAKYLTNKSKLSPECNTKQLA
jgi:thioredoxin reductase (NADPH)